MVRAARSLSSAAGQSQPSVLPCPALGLLSALASWLGHLLSSLGEYYPLPLPKSEAWPPPPCFSGLAVPGGRPEVLSPPRKPTDANVFARH